MSAKGGIYRAARVDGRLALILPDVNVLELRGLAR
jgi:hypothetical protein